MSGIYANWHLYVTLTLEKVLKNLKNFSFSRCFGETVLNSSSQEGSKGDVCSPITSVPGPRCPSSSYLPWPGASLQAPAAQGSVSAHPWSSLSRARGGSSGGSWSTEVTWQERRLHLSLGSCSETFALFPMRVSSCAWCFVTFRVFCYC